MALAGCGAAATTKAAAPAAAVASGGATADAKVIDVKARWRAPRARSPTAPARTRRARPKEWRKRFNEKFTSQGLQAKVVEFPASADEQRTQFVQRQEAKADDCDVFRSDVIWTAEFAQQGWIYDLTPYVESIKDRFIPAPLETATYDGKIWGSPQYTNAASSTTGPTRSTRCRPTWQELYKAAGDQSGIVYQGAAYEGLTCDWLELAFAAGGSVISADGKKATIDSPENVAATKLMAERSIKDGAAPKAVTTYMEPESLAAWQTGKYAFMRNWPYAYELSQDTAKLKGKFNVAPLPEFEGAGTAGILGGANSVISVYSKNPGGALALVDFLSSEEWQTVLTSEYSVPSPLKATWDAPEVKKALPFSDELRKGIEQAKARPVSPVYPQISQAIYKNVNRAISGQTSAEDAMKQAQSDIEKALATF